MAGAPLAYQTTDVSEKVASKVHQSLPTMDPSRSLLSDLSPQKKGFDFSNVRDSTDDQNLDMRNDATIAVAHAIDGPERSLASKGGGFLVNVIAPSEYVT